MKSNAFLAFMLSWPLIAMGIIMTFYMGATDSQHTFASIRSLDVLDNAVPLWLLGILAIAAGVLILIPKTKIVGYFIGLVLSSAVAITAIIGLWTTADPHSPLVFFLVSAATAYAGGLFSAITQKYDPRDVDYHENDQDSGKAIR